MSEYKSFQKQNEEASEEKCHEVINALYKPIFDRVRANEFIQPGGYDAYTKEMKDLEMKYNSTPGKGIMVRIFLS